MPVAPTERCRSGLGRCRKGFQTFTLSAPRISQHDLGNMVGASRETVNKQLALWRSAGILDTERGALVIRNLDPLRELIGCT